MSTLFRNRYRIASTRSSTHDYSKPGWYYVTINTRDRIDWFGHVRHKRMCVNLNASIVWNCWFDIPNHFSNVSIDTFIVIPDHVHGIIRINYAMNNPDFVETLRDSIVDPSLQRASSLITYQPNTFGPLRSHSLSSIVHAFKSSITRIIRQSGHSNFKWQPRFYDRIIRTSKELENVRRYILDNPRNWNG